MAVKRDLNWYTELATRNGGKCLATQYVGCKVKIPWECKEGHRWETTACLVGQDKWCRICAMEALKRKPDENGLWFCGPCQRKLPVEMFSKGQRRCKECYKRYLEDNRERVSAQKKVYYEENKPAILAEQKKYYEKNKEHHGEMTKKYREEHKEELSEYFHEHYQDNKDQILLDCKKRYAVNRQSILDKNLEKNYGITRAQFDEELRLQAGGCAICSTKEPSGMGRFNVDHDHTTGINRGLLCSHCNASLGCLRDSISRIEKAIHYLNTSVTLILFKKELSVRFPEEYAILMECCGGKCQICRSRSTGNVSHPKLSVDHDHKTGIVRGLLCHYCNIGIGGFKDDPIILQKAIDYLKKYGGCSSSGDRLLPEVPCV